MIDLTKLGCDKLGHAVAGTLIWAIAILLGATIWFAIGIAAVAAALKEGYDYLHRDRHTPDFWDWVATVSLPVIISLVIFYRLWGAA